MTPFQDPAFRRSSIHFDDLEFQRRFEQNLIRFGLMSGAQVTEEINNSIVISGGGGGGDGGDAGCYWTKEGSNLVYYEGNVGVGIHPHLNDFHVKGNVLVAAADEQAYLEIRNWSDTARDPVLKWALGATPSVKFAMGVDDSDSDKLKIANRAILGTLAAAEGAYGEELVFFHIQEYGFCAIDTGSFTGAPVNVYQCAASKSDGDRFSSPYEHVYDGQYIYYGDWYKIQKIDPETDTFIAKCVLATNHWGLTFWNGKLYTISLAGYGSPSRIHLLVIDADTMTLDADYEFGVGSDDDEFSNTRGICTDGTNLFVCDWGNGRVKKCTMAGAYVSKYEPATGVPISCEVAGDYLYVCAGSSDSKLHILNKSTMAVDELLEMRVRNGYTPGTAAIAVNGTHFYVFCSRTSPNNTIDKYDIATRTYQEENTTVVDGSATGVVYSMHIAPFAAAGVRSGDLIVVHHDGIYTDIWPKVRLMDDLRLVEDGDDEDGDYVGLKAPAAVTTSYDLTFPAALPGAQSHISCSTAGVLSFGQDVNTTASPSFVRLTLTQATGTAPLTVSSTTVVTNLNADLWDGYHQFMSTVVEPTGFPNRTDTALSFNDATRVFTVTGTNFKVWLGGVEYTLSTDTTTLADSTGLYFIYYAISGTTLDLVNSTVFPGMNVALVAFVYYNTAAGMDKGLASDERHGLVMDHDTHLYLHDTVGTRYESGLAGTFADSTFEVTAGYIWDEDIRHTIATATTCDVLYKDGSADWKWLENQTVYYYTSGGNLYYNDGNTLTVVPANQYVAAWIFATPSIDRPIVAIIGQRVDTTIANARNNNTYQSLSLGTLPFVEMKLLYRVILRNDVTPYEETQDLRSVSNLSTGTYVATAHNALTGLATGDDHTQYVYCKLHATDAPAATDDLATYREGTLWVEQDLPGFYVCVDNPDDAAVWLGFNQSLLKTSSPEFAGLTLTGEAGVLKATAGVVSDDAALNDLADVNAGAPDDEDVLTWDDGTSKWIAAPSGGGAAAFLDLTDVDEADYVGHEGDFVVVNAAADGLEFTASSVAGHALVSASHTDVTVSAPNDNDILRYDSGSSKWVCEALPASANHDVLDGSVHGDTLAGAVSRGSIIYGNATPKWAELVVGTVGQVLTTDGTDVYWAAAGGAAHALLSATHNDTTATAVARGSIVTGQGASPTWAQLTVGAAGRLLVSDGTDVSWGDWLGFGFFGKRIPGRYYSTCFTANPATGTSAFALNVLYALPFWVGARQSFDRIVARVTSAAGAGNKARLGIYTSSASTGLPDALVVDSGEIAIDSTGAKEAVIAVTLNPGLYWLAYNGQATATFRAFSAIGLPGIFGQVDTTTYTSHNYCSVAQAYGALPDPFTVGAATGYAATAAYIQVRAA